MDEVTSFIQFKENYFEFLREVNDSMGYICEAKMKNQQSLKH